MTADMRGRRRGRPALPPVGRYPAWGLGAGAVVGGVAGLVIGIRTYLPTCAFAAVEGAVVGAIGCTVLACLAAGSVLLARVLARR